MLQLIQSISIFLSSWSWAWGQGTNSRFLLCAVTVWWQIHGMFSRAALKLLPLPVLPRWPIHHHPWSGFCKTLLSNFWASALAFLQPILNTEARETLLKWSTLTLSLASLIFRAKTKSLRYQCSSAPWSCPGRLLRTLLPCGSCTSALALWNAPCSDTCMAPSLPSATLYSKVAFSVWPFPGHCI